MFDIVNLQAMCDAQKPVPMSRVQKALECCVEIGPDIIIISAATVSLVGNEELHCVIQKLDRMGCFIVAALNNRQYKSLPAAYPEVIGVRCDRKNHMNQGVFCKGRFYPFTKYT